MILWRLSLEAQEIWGVMMQLGAVSSGLSDRIGSVDTTSNPAAYTLPLRSAAARSSRGILFFSQAIFPERPRRFPWG